MQLDCVVVTTEILTTVLFTKWQMLATYLCASLKKKTNVKNIIKCKFGIFLILIYFLIPLLIDIFVNFYALLWLNDMVGICPLFFGIINGNWLYIIL